MSKAVKTMPYDFRLLGLGAMAGMLVVVIVSAPYEYPSGGAYL